MANSPLLFGPNNTAINLQIGEVGSDGSVLKNDGPKNYIRNATAANGLVTPGWSLFNTTLTSGLPTGSITLTAGTLTLTSTTTNPLSASASANNLLMTSAAGTTAGQGIISDVFTIDRDDQAMVLTGKFRYEATNGANVNWSGILGSQSYGVYIYDSANSAWIQPQGFLGMNQSTSPGYCTFTFQTNALASGATYRVAIIALQATVAVHTIAFNEFYIGPQTAPIGSIITAPQSWTPTVTGLGTVTINNAQWSRVGNYLQATVSIIAGTTTATAASFSLPPGLSIDTTIINGNGYVGTFGATATPFVGDWFLQTGTSTTLIYFGSGSASYATPQSGSVWATGTVFTGQIRVPIAGWGGTVQMSNDADTRVIAARVVGCTATITGSYSDVAFTTVSNDTSGSYSSPNYTAPVSGYYCFTGQLYISGTAALNSTVNIGLFNTTTTTTLSECGASYGGAVTTATGIQFDFQEVYLAAGTQIKIQVKSSITSPVISASTTQNYLQVSRRSGPAVIAATESVNARYYNSATTISGVTATIVWSTKDFDTHNAMVLATGLYTIPVSGKYLITAALATAGTISLNTQLALQIQKNSVAVSECHPYAGGAVTNLVGMVTDTISCVAGDVIKIAAGSTAVTPTIVSSNTLNYFSIQRVGN